MPWHSGDCLRAPASVFCTEQLQGHPITTHQQARTPALNHDHDRFISDRLLLTTVAGAADLLADDLRNLNSTTIADIADDGVRCHFTATINSLRTIRICRSVAIVLDQASSAVPELSSLHASLGGGVLSALAPRSPIRFRVGLTDARQRNAVITAIQDRTGWHNDPADWQINITRHGGLWIAEVGDLHYRHRFNRLRRQPWSTNPVLATVLTRIAKIKADQTVHDPFCGTGTILIAAHQAHPSARLTGTDNDQPTLELARANLHDNTTPAILTHADAVPFPHPDGAIDRVVSNLPFGKQVGNHAANTTLYPAIMREIARTLRPSGRAVVLTEDKRLLVHAVAKTPGVKIIDQRLLRYGGATPTAYTITPTRRSQRSRTPHR